MDFPPPPPRPPLRRVLGPCAERRASSLVSGRLVVPVPYRRVSSLPQDGPRGVLRRRSGRLPASAKALRLRRESAPRRVVHCLIKVSSAAGALAPVRCFLSGLVCSWSPSSDVYSTRKLSWIQRSKGNKRRGTRLVEGWGREVCACVLPPSMVAGGCAERRRPHHFPLASRDRFAGGASHALTPVTRLVRARLVSHGMQERVPVLEPSLRPAVPLTSLARRLSRWLLAARLSAGKRSCPIGARVLSVALACRRGGRAPSRPSPVTARATRDSVA